MDLEHSLIDEEATTAEQLERVQMLETAVQDMLRVNYQRKAQVRVHVGSPRRCRYEATESKVQCKETIKT